MTKGNVKAYTVDKYLHPIRLQISELIPPNKTVMEFGCGNGDLLFKLSDKIHSGIGLDKSKKLINYATKLKIENGITNLEFRNVDLTHKNPYETHVDISIASLLFHILPPKEASELLQKILAISETTIICGFCAPQNTKQKLLLWLDQRFTGHYSNFKRFQKNGFTEGLLDTTGHLEYTTYHTFDPVIKIYEITHPRSKTTKYKTSKPTADG